LWGAYLIPVTRTVVIDQEIKDQNWLVGCFAVEGEWGCCFYISINKSKTATGFAVQLKLTITQHSRDKELMENLVTYLECGRYEARSKDKKFQAGNFVVTKLSDITEKIIPFFDKYPILGCKSEELCGFQESRQPLRNIKIIQ